MKLPRLISDGCVLNRGDTTRIWGESIPGDSVRVEFQGKTYSVNADSAGHWQVRLSNLEPGEGYQLRIRGNDAEVTIQNVFVGEVWLCAGQSNMQITFARIGRRYPEVMSAPPEPWLRHFLVEPSFSDTEQRDTSSGAWNYAAPQHISDMTAIGYFFAKRRMEQTGVPIGIIAAAVGGTAIASWQRTEFVPKTALPPSDTAIPAPGEPCDPTVTQGGGGLLWWHKRITIPEQFANKASELALGTIIDADVTYVNGQEVGRTEYRYPPRYYAVPPLKAGETEIVVRQSIFGAWGKFTEGKTRELRFPNGTIPLDGDWRRRKEHRSKPLNFVGELPPEFAGGAYYRSMIAPLTRFDIKGVLWYQGESDAGNPYHYAEAFSHMTKGWREAWGVDLPFLTVGLARWDESDWTDLREQQKLCARLPGVAFFDAWEYGEPNDLHPLEKKPIGEGLAALALELGRG